VGGVVAVAGAAMSVADGSATVDGLTKDTVDFMEKPAGTQVGTVVTKVGEATIGLGNAILHPIDTFNSVAGSTITSAQSASLDNVKKFGSDAWRNTKQSVEFVGKELDNPASLWVADNVLQPVFDGTLMQTVGKAIDNLDGDPVFPIAKGDETKVTPQSAPLINTSKTPAPSYKSPDAKAQPVVKIEGKEYPVSPALKKDLDIIDKALGDAPNKSKEQEALAKKAVSVEGKIVAGDLDGAAKEAHQAAKVIEKHNHSSKKSAHNKAAEDHGHHGADGHQKSAAHHAPTEEKLTPEAQKFKQALHNAGFGGNLNQAISAASKAFGTHMVRVYDMNDNDKLDSGEIFQVQDSGLNALNAKLAEKGKSPFNL
jgi:hypothetical protein